MAVINDENRQLGACGHEPGSLGLFDRDDQPHPEIVGVGGSGAVAVTVSLHPLCTLRQTVSQWLFIPDVDQDCLDVFLAVYYSNRMPGDPLWCLYIDASGGGKTEILRAPRKRPDAFYLSKLTEKSLKSGYRDPKDPKKDPSLLPQLHGKVLIVKDLSPLLSMRRESRASIIGDLRDAYDGFSDDGYGNIGRVSYEARFTLIAATTMAIERFGAVDEELGERFIKYRARGMENRHKVRRAIQNEGKDDAQRTDIAAAMNKFMDGLGPPIAIDVPGDIQDRLITVADLISTARSPVARDRNHDLCYIPRPEVGTRLGKQFRKLSLALAHIRGKSGPDEADFRTVCRVAEDCLPPNRLLILRSIVSGGPCELPVTTAKHTREDLKTLGILDGDLGLCQKWKQELSDVPLFR